MLKPIISGEIIRVGLLVETHTEKSQGRIEIRVLIGAIHALGDHGRVFGAGFLRLGGCELADGHASADNHQTRNLVFAMDAEIVEEDRSAHGPADEDRIVEGEGVDDGLEIRGPGGEGIAGLWCVGFVGCAVTPVIGENEAEAVCQWQLARPAEVILGPAM